MEGMMATGRFDWFVASFIEQYGKDQLEKTRWEYWLHRVFDQSYQDYIASLGMTEKSAAPTKEQQIAAVRKSCEILNGLSGVRAGENGRIQDSGNNSG